MQPLARIYRGVSPTRSYYAGFDGVGPNLSFWKKYLNPVPGNETLTQVTSRLEARHNVLDVLGINTAIVCTLSPIDMTNTALYFGLVADAAGVVQLRLDQPTYVGDQAVTNIQNGYYMINGNAVFRVVNGVLNGPFGINYAGTHGYEILMMGTTINFILDDMTTQYTEPYAFSSHLLYFLWGERSAQNFNATDFLNELAIIQNPNQV